MTSRRSIAGLALAWALSLNGTQSAADPEPPWDTHVVEQELKVDGPGLISVELVPVGALADSSPLFLSPWPDGVHVHDPDGNRIERTKVLRPASGSVAVRTVSLSEHTNGWSLVLDLGPGPIWHSRFSIDTAKAVSARGCRLASSEDRESWTDLAEGDLFRLGNRPDLEKMFLDYSPTNARFLQLAWPRETGFPEFRTLTVNAVRTPVDDLRRLPVPVTEIVIPGWSRRHAIAMIDLPVGDLIVRGIESPVDARGRFAFRLFDSFSADARLVAEQIVEDSDRSRLDRFNLDIERPVQGHWRLDWFGSDRRVAPPKSLNLLYEPHHLLFDADRAGTYKLAVGLASENPANAQDSDRIPSQSPVTDLRPAVHVTPGPARRPPPSLPIDRPELERLPPARGLGGLTWDIRAERSSFGHLVRLELPDRVFASLAGELRGLRVSSGEHLLPFHRRLSSNPHLLGFEPSGGSRTRQHEISLPANASKLLNLELMSVGPKFDAQVSVDAVSVPRPGVEPVKSRIARVPWRCATRDPLPCRISIRLPRRVSARTVVVEIEPVAPWKETILEGLLTYQVEELLFVMPGSGKAKIVSGYELIHESGSKHVDRWIASGVFASRGAAHLAIEAPVSSRIGRILESRATLLAVLVLSGVVLLVILRRTLLRR